MSRYNDDPYSNRRYDSGGRDRSPDRNDYDRAGAAPPYPMESTPPQPSAARLRYEPQGVLYPPPRSSSNSLQPPSPRSNRPRSVPSLSTSSMRAHDSRSGSPSSRRRRPDSPPRSPLNKARHAVENAFTPSTSGLSVGVLGALVGGLAAREASEATTRTRDHEPGGHHGGSSGKQKQQHDKARLISTIVGAAVGGLGANALEKRLEVGRVRDREEQAEWDRKWGSRGGGSKDAIEDKYDDDDEDGGASLGRRRSGGASDAGARGHRRHDGGDGGRRHSHGSSGRNPRGGDDVDDRDSDYDYVYDTSPSRRSGTDSRRYR